MTIIDVERPEVTHEDRSTAVATAPPAPVDRATVTPQAAPARAASRPARRRLFADMAGPLSSAWGFGLVVAWIVVIAVGLAIEPAPAHPNAPVPLLADIVSTGMMAAWGAMAAGVFQRRRFAAAASLAGGVALLALTVACPLSGHHSGVGAWWGIQMVGALSLLALSRRALRSS